MKKWKKKHIEKTYTHKPFHGKILFLLHTPVKESLVPSATIPVLKNTGTKPTFPATNKSSCYGIVAKKH